MDNIKNININHNKKKKNNQNYNILKKNNNNFDKIKMIQKKNVARLKNIK